MKTAVVILNWNTKEHLRRFLLSLVCSTEGLDAEVVVVDNASTDGSLELMKSYFPEVRTIALDKNYGFTGGYNESLARIDAEYYVLINSDIEVTPGWLDSLLEWMDTHPECGACGPKLLSWYDRDSFEYAGAAGGMLDRWGYPFCRGRVLKKLEKDIGQYDEVFSEVLWASGACLMVRSSLWHKLKGLDSRFFAHMEEIDFCWRMQLEGYYVSIVPDSVVYHLGGGTLPNDSPFKLKLNYRNNLLLLENNLARTFLSQGMSARKSLRKASCRISWRMVLDGCSAAVYLMTGRKECFKAVVTAHEEYKKLRRTISEDDLKIIPAKVRGLWNGSIIAASLLKGNNIFKYLKDNENRH